MLFDSAHNSEPPKTINDFTFSMYQHSSLYQHLSFKVFANQFALLAFTFFGLSACDRPFVPPVEPIINIVAPIDPSALQFTSFVEIRVEASSFREISKVEIDGQPFVFDSVNGNWQTVVTLTPGLNNLEIAAFDIENVPGIKTLTLAHVNPSYDGNAPSFPAPWRLGGHTASLLSDGSILVAGGALGSFQDAVPQTFILPSDADEFIALTSRLTVSRVGHSATLLPDGRVLILGGGTTAAATNVSQLVSTAEVYNPVTGVFTEVDFVDAPLIRMEHVAFVSMGPTSLIIDVYGGLGSDPNSDSDRLVIRGDIRSFRFRDDTLTPISNFSDSVIQPAYGIASTLLNGSNASEMGRYVVSGVSFLESGEGNANFSIDFNQTPIRVVPLEKLLTPRIQHASAALEPGLIGIFGGFQGTLQNATSSTEIFVESNNRFSNIDSQVSTRRRFSHTATKLPSQRILILGGFSETGEAISEAEYFDWGL